MIPHKGIFVNNGSLTVDRYSNSIHLIRVCDALIKESISQFSWNQNHHSTSRKHAESDCAVKSWDGREGSSRPRPPKCLGLLSTCNGSLDSKLLKLPFPSSSPNPLHILRLFCRRRRFDESSLLFLSPFRHIPFDTSTLSPLSKPRQTAESRSAFSQFSWLFSKSQALAMIPKSKEKVNLT